MNYIQAQAPLIENPTNLDAAIQKLQIALSNINWLERVYGKAHLGLVTRENKEYRQPEVYVGNGNYLILEPNNYLSAHAFFKAEGSADAIEYKPFLFNRFSQRVSIIIWVNLERIKERVPTITYKHKFVEELKSDVLNVLRQHGDFVLSKIFETPSDVYAGYSLNHLSNQTFKYPEAGFRIEGLLHYRETC